jgi:CelD/BcsL family acetyltransferase involved in cellulose biosynthesis
MSRVQAFDGGVAMAPLTSPSSVAPSDPDYDIEILHEPMAARDRLTAAFADGIATPFQAPGWLAAWYGAVAPTQDAEPLIVFVTERETGRLVAALPLIQHRVDGLQVIAFADLGVTDYNAPILGPAAPVTVSGARTLWRAISKALPPADLIKLQKMPITVGGRPNPLACVPGVYPSHSPGFSVAIGDDWNAYLRSLAKKFRKELGRSFRLFEKEGEAVFRRIETVEEALSVLEIMNQQQQARLTEMGSAYALDADAYHAFYARLVTEGLEDGTTILTALVCDGDIVAALLGITDGTSFTMVRLGHAGGDWMKIGPGRLVIERSMQLLHGHGCRQFDFSIGDYPYKAGFGVKPSALVDLIVARTWRSRASAAGDLIKAAVKRWLGTMGMSLEPQAVRNRYRRYHGSD